MVVEGGVSRLCRGALRHEGGGAGVSDGEGAPCCALLPPGLGWQGLEIVEDIRGGLGLRCRRSARLGRGLGCGSGLEPRCGDGLGLLLGGGLGWWPGVAAGWGFGRAAATCFTGVPGGSAWLVEGYGAAGALAVAGAPAVETGVEAGLGDVARGFGGDVLDEGVVVEVDEVIVVVVVVELEAEETD